MKQTPQDKAASNLIREAFDWTCAKCGYVSEEGRMRKADRFIQCSHFNGRQHKTVRYDTKNLICLCASCHAKVETQPDLHHELYVKVYGKVEMNRLRKRLNSRFKLLPYMLDEITKKYKEDFKRIDKLRMNGIMGYIEPINLDTNYFERQILPS